MPRRSPESSSREWRQRTLIGGDTLTDRQVWIGAISHPSRESRKKIVLSALENGFDTIVLEKKDSAFTKLGKFRTITLSGKTLTEGGEPVGKIVEIAKKEDELKAKRLAEKGESVVISAKDWKIIPLENLIVHFQGTNASLLMMARTADEAKLFFETMEHGSDGVVFVPSDTKELTKLRKIMEAGAPKVDLREGKIAVLRQLGLGDRVCIDTCSVLRIGEGMLIGNQSSCMFLIHSETIESEYAASRPFRVNAGPVHAYILMPDGSTRYLSELRGGEEVLVVDSDGHTRKAIIGRTKVERRPLLLIEAEVDGSRYSTIVQNAETIRVYSKGKVVSVSKLKIGDPILLRLEKGGRHFGMYVEETIQEM
ncbi:MAG: 3-dehydroquinate synthase II [Methanobacteriota archaeon]|nr:MAG: 3-dehydroquinate synthase II [Euryarchaeota archaeon]